MIPPVYTHYDSSRLYSLVEGDLGDLPEESARGTPILLRQGLPELLLGIGRIERLPAEVVCCVRGMVWKSTEIDRIRGRGSAGEWCVCCTETYKGVDGGGPLWRL